MLTSRKSEVTIEFISLVGFLLIIFIIVLIVIGLKNNDISTSTIYSDAQRTSNLIANEINFAASIRGYYRVFEIPPKLVNNIEYSVSINTDFRLVEIKWDTKSVTSNIITNNVSGTINPGVNKIKNDGGGVLIES